MGYRGNDGLAQGGGDDAPDGAAALGALDHADGGVEETMPRLLDIGVTLTCRATS